MSIPAHLSYSQIGDILTCSHKYELSRVYNAPKMPACYLIGGTVVHHVTHTIDVGWPDLDVPSDVVHELCRKEFDKEVEAAQQKEPDTAKWQVGGRGKETLEWWAEQAPIIVGRWVDFRRDSNLTVLTLRNGMPATEVDFVVQYGGKPFKGGIDRILIGKTTDEKAIVDLKTGSRMPTNPFQLAFYRDAAQMVHGIKVRFGYYWSSRTGQLSHPFDLDQIPYEMTNHQARTAAKIIDQRLFMPNPGFLCGSCEVKSYCRTVGGDPNLLEGYVNNADR